MRPVQNGKEVSVASDRLRHIRAVLRGLRRVSCVTLMVNRSDRRFQTLSPRMAARGRETDQPKEARGNPSRPGLHLTPDKQAGYMTATEFQIAPAIQPLTRAGSIYMWRADSPYEPPSPYSQIRLLPLDWLIQRDHEVSKTARGWRRAHVSGTIR